MLDVPSVRLRSAVFTMRQSGQLTFLRHAQDELNRYAGLNHKCKDLTTDLQELQDWRDSIRDAVAEIDMMDPKAPDFK